MLANGGGKNIIDGYNKHGETMMNLMWANGILINASTALRWVIDRILEIWNPRLAVQMSCMRIMGEEEMADFHQDRYQFVDEMSQWW